MHCNKQMNGEGVLASVRDEYTNDFLVKFTAFAGSSPEATSWIGGYYNSEDSPDSPWFWLDQSDFHYNHVLGWIEGTKGLASLFNVWVLYHHYDFVVSLTLTY